MGRFKGRMTRKRLERLKEEGLLSKEEALDYEAQLFIQGKDTSERYARMRERRELEKNQAGSLAERALTDDEVRQKLRFTESDVEALNQTIRGPMRHALAVQGGLKLKAMVNGLLDMKGGGGDVQVRIVTIPTTQQVGSLQATITTDGGKLPPARVDELDDDPEE